MRRFWTFLACAALAAGLIAPPVGADDRVAVYDRSTGTADPVTGLIVAASGSSAQSGPASVGIVVPSAGSYAFSATVTGPLLSLLGSSVRLCLRTGSSEQCTDRDDRQVGIKAQTTLTLGASVGAGDVVSVSAEPLTGSGFSLALVRVDRISY